MTEVKIEIGGAMQDDAAAFVDAWQRAAAGEDLAPSRVLAFESWDAMTSFLAGVPGRRLTLRPRGVAVRSLHFAIVLAGVAIMTVPRAASAQQSEDQSPAARALNGESGPGNIAVPNGSSGAIGRHGRPSQDQDSAPGAMPALKPVGIPRQRLDTGALFCQTEAQLKQHQAAIMARLAGRDAPEPGGCHLVGETVPVAIVAQDGQAVTEVRTADDPPRTGWTDAVIRDSDPLHSPLH